MLSMKRGCKLDQRRDRGKGRDSCILDVTLRSWMRTAWQFSEDSCPFHIWTKVGEEQNTGDLAASFGRLGPDLDPPLVDPLLAPVLAYR